MGCLHALAPRLVSRMTTRPVSACVANLGPKPRLVSVYTIHPPLGIIIGATTALALHPLCGKMNRTQAHIGKVDCARVGARCINPTLEPLPSVFFGRTPPSLHSQNDSMPGRPSLFVH
jgi:hypothetical protein